MNRRLIKFRAWDKRLMKLEMIYNIQDGSDFRGQSFGEYLNYPDCYDVMEYTGLQDSSGKDIYEGDLLMDKKQLISGIWYQVIFDKGWFVAEYEDGKGRPRRRDIAETEFLKMGNIYENPDLLEFKK